MVAVRQFRILIPARSGSSGIKNKNIADLNGHPLLAYTIRVALSILPKERVWVSTDSPSYADIAEEYGATVPFIRPAHLASDNSSDFEVFQHARRFEASQESISRSEYWVHLRPTTPLRRPATVLAGMRTIANHRGAESLRSVEPIIEKPQKWMVLRKGRLRTLTGRRNLDWSNRPRQQFETVYRPNGLVDVIKNSTLERGNFHGRKSLGFVTNPTIDIDSAEDLEAARTETEILSEIIRNCF